VQHYKLVKVEFFSVTRHITPYKGSGNVPPIVSGFPFPKYDDTSRCLYGQFIQHNNKISCNIYIYIYYFYLTWIFSCGVLFLFIVKGKGKAIPIQAY